jgi:hypothetical protein
MRLELRAGVTQVSVLFHADPFAKSGWVSFLVPGKARGRFAERPGGDGESGSGDCKTVKHPNASHAASRLGWNKPAFAARMSGHRLWFLHDQLGTTGTREAARHGS